MTALIIIGAILLVLFGLGMLRATVSIEYRDEVKLSVRVLFLRLGILPKKQKFSHSLSAKKLRRLLEKDAKKEKKKEEKKAAKKAAKEQKKLEKKQMAKEQALNAQIKAKRTLPENLELIGSLLSLFFSRFSRHLRIKVTRLNLVIATADAAKTAIMYGYASQGVAYILELLDNKTNVKYKKDATVSVTVDYLAQKPTADVAIAFSLRVWHLLDIALRAGVRYFTLTSKSKKK